ncbi:MAG TPA: FIST N-terminal domain-containing protein [Flavobacteriales bacterium]|nr:FIST N-terminal domain-containing protein [Flavobacteriales bacterium]
MKIEQKTWTSHNGWENFGDGNIDGDADLVIAFGAREALASDWSSEIKKAYPSAQLLSASTSGEIVDTMVWDDSIITTAVKFEKTKIRTAELTIDGPDKSYEAGKSLVEQLKADDLVHIFVLSDGLKVNGSELVKGFNDHLPPHISVTGGLAGDGAKFEKTLVGISGKSEPGNIVAMGFYGKDLNVGFGSVGGWDSFGPTRVVTKSVGNVLYELDGQPALELYKKYLGDQAAGLPGTGLHFPLSIKVKGQDEPIVRTILAVDDAANSLTFAGDIPQGATAQLMKANFEKIIEGASHAAGKSVTQSNLDSPELAILISCVGRKLILSQRIEEEVESVRDIVGEKAVMTGFYSYGEISPFTPNAKCELHNQTMTITTFREN